MDTFTFENAYGERSDGTEMNREFLGGKFWIIWYKLDQPLEVQGNMPPTSRMGRIIHLDRFNKI